MAVVPWKRLVRYISSNGEERFGEPIVSSDADDVTLLQDAGQLEVYICEGDDPLAAKPTSQTEKPARLLGPLRQKDVPIIICIGLNYKTHILESGNSLPQYPTIFTKPAPAVADHEAVIPIAKIAQAKVDYEGELTIVIGKDCKNVSPEKALDYVAGYTAGNDVSARDWQIEKGGPMPQATFSKSFDKSAPLGPCIVSAEVLGAADKQSLKTVVNGQVRQDSNTSDLCFGVRDLVSFCSQGHTLQRGSLIMTGTPAGVAHFMKPPQYLKPGDKVDITFGGIGTLRNKIDFE